MRLNCCILEDEKMSAKQLIMLLEQWGKERNCEVLIDTALSANHFFQRNLSSYEIIFIDIVLTGDENGIEIARKLRGKTYKGDIVFLTNFQEFVFDGYPVNALDYLLKPASYEKICRCMDCVLDKNVEKVFVYRLKDRIIQVPYQEILYLQSSNHSTDVITVEKTYSIPLSFRNIQKLFPGQFSRCHRTLIVNLYYIESMTNKEIQLTNKERLPISQTYLNSLRTDFIRVIQNRRSL